MAAVHHRVAVDLDGEYAGSVKAATSIPPVAVDVVYYDCGSTSTVVVPLVTTYDCVDDDTLPPLTTLPRRESSASSISMGVAPWPEYFLLLLLSPRR